MRSKIPRALDLFCGAGGATRGLQLAGFHVTGIDNKPQPRYCGDAFIQADALNPPVDLREFDFVWASPPCQRYTMAQNAAKNRDAHPDLVEPVRNMLMASGVPWVMENVIGAPLINPVVLCGLAFGLKVKRHRLIEPSHLLLVPPCPSHDQDYYVIFGHEVRNRRTGAAAGRKNKIAEGRRAMGIDWMTRGELSESIPPAYSHFIAKQFLEMEGITSHVSETTGRDRPGTQPAATGHAWRDPAACHAVDYRG
jgi:DNA (cytosine-5)-methyltransferase 1